MDKEESSLPVSIRNFVTARVDEVIALSKELEASGDAAKKLAFQHVPNHMRRRAVSHNVKRLPKRLQAAHLGQLTKGRMGKDKKPKRPNRKFRRRKSNLLSEYNRRQQSIKWTETHIWHAKRFHMKSKWNYRIPIEPTDKSYRAIYRAYTQYSVMQDISYYTCIQLVGPVLHITEKMKRLAPVCTNRLTLNAKYYKEFSREGSLHLYQNGKYPYGYIGPVDFFWKLDLTTLWLWIHPSFKQQVVDELIEVFELHEPVIKVSKEKQDTKPTATIDAKKLEPKQLNQPKVWKNSNNLEMTDLEGAVNRIRLYGPESTAILQQVLHVKSFPPDEPMEVADSDKDSKLFWYEKYYSSKSTFWKKQSDIWSCKYNWSNFPAHLILPLTVRDPRMFLPKKRMKVQIKKVQDGENDVNQESFQTLLEHFCKENESPLWDKNWRDSVLNEKMTDFQLTKERGKLLIPGTEIDLGRNENQIPILLIHKPENSQGWDIIVPAGYAMPFWIALSYRSVRAGGHRDALHFTFSNLTSAHPTPYSYLSPNLLPPDSVTGQQENDKQQNQIKETYFRLPPDKRQHFQKLLCPFPFHIDWMSLLQFWHQKCENLPKTEGDGAAMTTTTAQAFVLRDYSLLERLRQSLFLSSLMFISDLVFAAPSLPIPVANCLIPISVVCKGRGKPRANGLICIPTQSDLDCFYAKPQPSDDGTNGEYSRSEAPQSSKILHELESEKAELKQRHKKRLAFLRKKRKKQINNAAKQDEVFDVQESEYDSREICEEYNSAMNQLYLPKDPMAVLNDMSRLPIGFITFGADSYQIGKGAGIGYVTWSGYAFLIQLYKGYYNELAKTHLRNICKLKAKTKNPILIRDSKTSLLYRFAELHIL